MFFTNSTEKNMHALRRKSSISGDIYRLQTCFICQVIPTSTRLLQSKLISIQIKKKKCLHCNSDLRLADFMNYLSSSPWLPVLLTVLKDSPLSVC